ncbi:Thp1p ASCRUDRAFT_6571 [Ascoidea rubescens DSM 1968]|uniref:PCI domain-containing protein n=1 Tax=Ascoidea rubescens DSM 1968 TaxID=1344418 RepID=A0A1D2VMV4_9ASCO|nr:hypothetical protein ASCRUDRAFT_6571 [Ascoidea rubescens DSM 1968]ODV62951.1 hypothetical protein ASCRUDRAFT_6571 [Ascoidea rubescens DSM 1968]
MSQLNKNKPVFSLLNDIQSLIKSNDPALIQKKLSSLLSVNFYQNPSNFASLQNDLIINNNNSYNDLEKLIESYSFFNNDLDSFNTLILSYLNLVKSLNPSLLLNSLKYLIDYLNNLILFYLNPSYGYYSSYLLINSLNFLIPILIQFNRVLNSNNHNSNNNIILSNLSINLLKIFNNIRSSFYKNNLKINLLLFISINLCKIYYLINQPLLIQNIFININTLKNLNFDIFPKSQQISYRYYLANHYFIKNDLINSFHHFNWCYNNFYSPNLLKLKNPTIKLADIKNLKIIVENLVVIGLLLGKKNFNHLNNLFSNYPNDFNFILTYYNPILIAVQSGNLNLFISHLFNNQFYFKKKNFLILLINKGELLIYRKLFQRVYLLRKNLILSNYNKEHDDDKKIENEISTIDYNCFNIALNHSIGDLYSKISTNTNNFNYLFKIQTNTESNLINDELIENILISLINSNFLKGNIFPKLQKIKVSTKNNPFPDIFQINNTRFSLNKNDAWLDK